jgi:hypothetical protein
LRRESSRGFHKASDFVKALGRAEPTMRSPDTQLIMKQA